MNTEWGRYVQIVRRKESDPGNRGDIVNGTYATARGYSAYSLTITPVEISGGIYRNPTWSAQPGGCGRTAIPAETRRSVKGYGADDPVGGDFPDPVSLSSAGTPPVSGQSFLTVDHCPLPASAGSGPGAVFSGEI